MPHATRSLRSQTMRVGPFVVMLNEKCNGCNDIVMTSH